MGLFSKNPFDGMVKSHNLTALKRKISLGSDPNKWNVLNEAIQEKWVPGVHCLIESRARLSDKSVSRMLKNLSPWMKEEDFLHVLKNLSKQQVTLIDYVEEFEQILVNLGNLGHSRAFKKICEIIPDEVIPIFQSSKLGNEDLIRYCLQSNLNPSTPPTGIPWCIAPEFLKHLSGPLLDESKIPVWLFVAAFLSQEDSGKAFDIFKEEGWSFSESDLEVWVPYARTLTKTNAPDCISYVEKKNLESLVPHSVSLNRPPVSRL